MDTIRDNQAFLRSYVNAEKYVQTSHQPSLSEIPPLVTVSRFCGASGTETATLLAERLGVKLYDKELVKTITQEIKVDKHLMSRLDEHVTSWLDDLVFDVFIGKGGDKEDYLQGMIRALIVISREGGVVVGRGAHLLTSNKSAFRVRLEGSLNVCAQRMSDRKGISMREAEKIIKSTNDERIKFVRKIYEKYTSVHNYYDMVVNSDTFSPDESVELILYTMEKMGFNIPKKKVS
ncbi:MAG: cytidylate kinase-like family protein [Magnetococcales bacterium]|nr:cytidylate kinase-like family protein [Magnetococcales bacterium]